MFTAAIKHLYKAGKYEPEMLQDEPLLGVVKETNRVLAAGLDAGIRDNQPPEAMLKALRNDVFVFSGYKTHQELSEVANMLLTSEGTIKPFNQFRQEVQSVHRAYNVNYLEAEYIFATSSAEMAARWGDFEKDGDRYNLQYRTAEDTKVRDTHRALRLTTLPVEDPFWDSYFPPNGWRCRCTTVQVRKGKFEESISAKQIAKGEAATSQIDKKGNNAAAIFRYNPGKQKVIFPPHHPYRQVKDNVKAAVDGISVNPATLPLDNHFKINKEVKSIQDLSDVMAEFAKYKPEYFEHGFKSIANNWSDFDANGITDSHGKIGLNKTTIMPHVISAFSDIKNGRTLSFKQEESIATLWHEINHNRAKKPYAEFGKSMSPVKIDRLELANEFISRKTLPVFFNDFGIEMQNKTLMSDRKSTGYNRMVKNYDTLIRVSGADADKVLADVQKHIFNEYEDTQTEGLVNAILNNTNDKLKMSQVKSAVIRCPDDGYNEDQYETYVTKLFKEGKK